MVILGGWAFLMSDVPLYTGSYYRGASLIRAEEAGGREQKTTPPQDPGAYRGISISADLGPYSRPMPVALWWS